MMRPTIFARASGSGRTAVAVVRISGPASGDAVTRLAGRVPPPRSATLMTLRDADGDPLDRALVLWFPAPRSFTGEDASELHLHGGRAVVGAVLKALSEVDGLRPAEPGEFTQRAFRNGKMDLSEVEALADLIEAETEAQRRQALRQLDGALGRWADALRSDLIEALALAEACIDFAEEDDLRSGFDAELRHMITAVHAGIERQLASSARAEKLREGLIVTIAGPPNVGKSTLMNRLAGRDVAIVSAFAGTTRDAIEVDLDLGGHMLRLIDTAGQRETEDPVEREGILRARAKAESADLVLWLDDGSTQWRSAPPARAELWRIATKADLVPALETADLRVSARTGEGVDALLARLGAFADAALAGSETALATRLRHRQALQRANRDLARILRQPAMAAELVAEDLRNASAALLSLTGGIEVEDILGGIFARFCIGK